MTDSSFDLIPVSQLPDLLPRRRRGAKLHYDTIQRWIRHGCRGVVLRTVRVGAQPCTTREWLMEFFEALAERNNDTSSSATGRRRHKRAERELEAAGI